MEESINYKKIIYRGLFILGILLMCNIIMFYIPFYNKKIEIKKIIRIDDNKSEIILLNPINKENLIALKELKLVDNLLNEYKFNTYKIEKNNKIILSHNSINLKLSYKIKLDLNLLQLISKNFN
jgi:hypothetical protein